jgi:hypothetical protein
MKYQLGIILNGQATSLWTGDHFPPLGLHTMLGRVVSAIRAAYPDASVESFNLCDGKTYSY